MRDDRLRLIFTRCHPALARPARVALTLRLLGGLTTAEIARAFLVPEPTMAQRLVRARPRSAMPHPLPGAGRRRPPRSAAFGARGRLPRVQRGLLGQHGDELVRSDLCAEAVRLGRLLAELMPDEPEVWGLLALMLLTEARPAPGPGGDVVLLADQDRRRWDRALVAEGQDLVRRCLRRAPGPYQIQAAIAAVHSGAAGRPRPTGARSGAVRPAPRGRALARRGAAGRGRGRGGRARRRPGARRRPARRPGSLPVLRGARRPVASPGPHRRVPGCLRRRHRPGGQPATGPCCSPSVTTSPRTGSACEGRGRRRQPPARSGHRARRRRPPRSPRRSACRPSRASGRARRARSPCGPRPRGGRRPRPAPARSTLRRRCRGTRRNAPRRRRARSRRRRCRRASVGAAGHRPRPGGSAISPPWASSGMPARYHPTRRRPSPATEIPPAAGEATSWAHRRVPSAAS